MIKHIVLFKFRDPEDCVETAREKLHSMVGVIPEILSMTTGADFLHKKRVCRAKHVQPFFRHRTKDAQRQPAGGERLPLHHGARKRKVQRQTAHLFLKKVLGGLQYGKGLTVYFFRIGNRRVARQPVAQIGAQHQRMQVGLLLHPLGQHFYQLG